MISDMAATVSVAQRTALSIITSFRVRASLKTYLLIKTMKTLMRMKPRMVPITPKKLIMPKC